jgi:glycosyltransferase involved in cell wall biosynthesis
LSDVAPTLTVLMPAFNEEANLATNVPLLMAHMSALGVEYELLIVDDGSYDATPRVADDLAAGHERVRVIHHAQNQGIGRALYTGFQSARGQHTIFVPADLAMDLDDLPKYLQAAQEADVIVGLRSDRRGTPLVRRLVSLANIALVRLLFGMPVRQFQYICMWPTRLLHEIAAEYPDSPFLQAEVLIKARDMGYRLAEVEVTYLPRARGHPAGGRARMVFKSAFDLFHFWPRWLFRRRSADGRRDWRAGARIDPLDAPPESATRGPASRGLAGSKPMNAPPESATRGPASHGLAGSKPSGAGQEGA